MPSKFLRARIPAWVGIGIVVVLVGGIVWIALTTQPATVDTSSTPVRGPLPAGTYPTEPLPVGSTLPALRPAGWVNGNPTPPTRLLVLDIWAHWCPSCREAAPELVQTYHTFKNRGVEFVSLTNTERSASEQFTESFQVQWPCGFGTDLAVIAEFGAYSSDRMSAGHNPGYEVTPTLYLADESGRVLWHDRQARPRHLKHASLIVQELRDEIERALKPQEKDAKRP